MSCTRCQCLMYPYSKNSPDNHARGYCSDGGPVWSLTSKAKNKPRDRSPPFPLPAGLFKKGKEFDPIKLLENLRSLYTKIATCYVTATDLNPEESAFLKLMIERIIIRDGYTYFKLYRDCPLVSADDIEFLIHTIDDSSCLRLDCISMPIETANGSPAPTTSNTHDIPGPPTQLDTLAQPAGLSTPVVETFGMPRTQPNDSELMQTAGY